MSAAEVAIIHLYNFALGLEAEAGEARVWDWQEWLHGFRYALDVLASEAIAGARKPADADMWHPLVWIDETAMVPEVLR